MKNLKKQNGLRLPSHFLKGTGLDQERSLLAALFPGVILLTRRFPSPQEREEIGEGLSCVARDLDLPLGTDGLVIPDEMLEGRRAAQRYGKAGVLCGGWSDRPGGPDGF